MCLSCWNRLPAWILPLLPRSGSWLPTLIRLISAFPKHPLRRRQHVTIYRPSPAPQWWVPTSCLWWFLEHRISGPWERCPNSHHSQDTWLIFAPWGHTAWGMLLRKCNAETVTQSNKRFNAKERKKRQWFLHHSHFHQELNPEVLHFLEA